VSQKIETSIRQSSLFVNAQDFIYNHGGNVAGIIRDKEGNLIHSFNDQLFVVYEWLYGRDLSFVNADDLKSALHGLAKFHIASKGYVARKVPKSLPSSAGGLNSTNPWQTNFLPGKKHPWENLLQLLSMLISKC